MKEKLVGFFFIFIFYFDWYMRVSQQEHFQTVKQTFKRADKPSYW